MLLARRLIQTASYSHQTRSLVRRLSKRTAPNLSRIMEAPSDIPPAAPSATAAAAAGGGSGQATPAEPEVYSDRWEQIWGAGLARGERFDAAAASPALVDLLQSGRVDVKGARVLVPGCGRGYDLPVFRSAGAAEVVGLELAPSAVREAREYLGEVTHPSSHPGGEAGQQGQQEAAQGADPAMRVEAGDFFEWTDGGFDMGYDYTFGCAMHPSARAQWAQSWGRQLRPGGLLVALVFPVNPEADPAVGPPFPVSPDLYTQLLGPQGFEVTYQQPVPGELSHPTRAGREVMMLLRKKGE
ncbi:hypothetical protein PLESTB_000642300 [Pleodorina starrii]|uniref:S-adenosyl-L-methionine-dependent methyltransferase n=1 Tax=Pleodorina starrii TaxID=330485 RepID=A0A9W6BIQ4_9CHLO|nr:hypothetical protein PLESTM_001303600 [Pleodorina starrii]GLC52553.1 hypothetical protein PLESTB_000642300 [Pleodorina starrii]GLC71553.1 hypothetical protein PLESTF_001134500 [Pleodorina starrii]